MSTDQRSQLFARARQLKTEIEQMFADVEHFNRINPAKLPLDADPDGKLRAMLDGINRMLASEVPA